MTKSGGFVPSARIGTIVSQPRSRRSFSASAEARFSIVAPWKRRPSGSLIPNVRSISANTRTASSEWPPRAKKSSVTPIGRRSRARRARSRTSSRSVSLRGSTISSSCCAASGVGQRVAVELAVRRQRERLDGDERRRDHEGRQLAATRARAARARRAHAPGRPARSRRRAACRPGAAPRRARQRCGRPGGARAPPRSRPARSGSRGS